MNKYSEGMYFLNEPSQWFLKYVHEEGKPVSSLINSSTPGTLLTTLQNNNNTFLVQ